MARLTVEDCEPFVANRFELVILAATRSRDILSGAPISVERDGDKTSVISLREIAAQSIDMGVITDQAIRQFQNVRYQVGFDQEEDTPPEDDFNQSASSDMVTPEFAVLEQQTLESGFDQVSDILDVDLHEDIESSAVTEPSDDGSSKTE